MFSRTVHSLRGRLAILCFIAAMMVVVLSQSLFIVNEEIIITAIENGRQEIVHEETTVSKWIIPTTIALAFPIAFLSWIWAGGVVRPINEITKVASDIQSGSLNRRIELPQTLSELQGLSQQFNRMMDRLADGSKIQTQLIEDTSHEIRTPLATLAANAEVMLSDPSPNLASYRASTELTVKTVSKLRLTVEELLSGAIFSNIKIRQSDNDLTIVAQRVVDLFQSSTPELQTDIVANFPDRLLCAFDGSSVERALSNLLDNAIRLSPPGESVTMAVGTENGRAFAFVEDRGVGIEKDKQDRVFDRYFSSSTSSSSSRGIGLAIVKQVAAAHDGITIDSPVEDERGTRFTLWFRL